MKTHELISLIEYISKIMAHYPNKSVEYALDDILNLLDARKKNQPPIVKEKQSSQILKKEDYLKSSKDMYSLRHIHNKSSKSDSEPNETLNDLSIEQLKKLANDIGIKTSSRQNKGILVMNITKTLERRRIDSTIKDKDKED
ncbi:hypothetical protein KPNIH19_01390 [Klebsiella pneumoniae subsp. pneumoniae KPNIH19]|nr:hypothetical protein KPNIH19_01390 [Klebsiella pneumoniae subsp. pneumoniae KPNIH19]